MGVTKGIAVDVFTPDLAKLERFEHKWVCVDLRLRHRHFEDLDGYGGIVNGR